MSELDGKAAQLKTVIDESFNKRKQVYEGGKVEGENITFRDIIGRNIDEVKKLRDEKKAHLDKLMLVKDNMKKIEDMKAKLLNGIPRNYHNCDDLEQAIKEKKTKDMKQRAFQARRRKNF